ncbi:unnamed protein product [Orchesella dallaii]|uniref:Uncharacterized protein n=1 Tax=Orchesella dallaii TaxID=48710 RepID=A0ABP1QN43_9HEXA
MSKMSSSGGSLSDAMVKIPRIRLKKNVNNNQNKIVGPADHIRVQRTSSSVNKQPISQQEALCHALHQSKQFHNMGERERGGYKNEDDDIHQHQTTNGNNLVLIKPKKIPNPIKESIAMQNIHKELLLNQKIGRSVLTHKSELQRALEKLAAKHPFNDGSTSPEPDGCESPDSLAPNPPPMPFNKQARHHNSQQSVASSNNKGDEFQRILEARAKLIEEQKCFVDGETKPDIPKESEFEKIHKKITNHNS